MDCAVGRLERSVHEGVLLGARCPSRIRQLEPLLPARVVSNQPPPYHREAMPLAGCSRALPQEGIYSSTDRNFTRCNPTTPSLPAQNSFENQLPDKPPRPSWDGTLEASPDSETGIK